MQAPTLERLDAAVRHAAHLLPGQLPLEAFVHHNTLHPFEDQHFASAVNAAGHLYGARAFLPEQSFRAAWRSGRILDVDIEDTLARFVPDREAPAPLDARPLRSMVRDLMLYQPPAPSPRHHDWLLHEGDVLSELPTEMSRGARERLSRAGDAPDVLAALWEASGRAAGRERALLPLRLRDRLVAGGRDDPDALADQLMIRWLGGYLDHGTSKWPMASRDLGVFATVVRHWTGRTVQAWTRALARESRQILARGDNAAQVAQRCIERLGVDESELDEYVLQTLLPLRGWAGMFVQLARRPDLAPGASPPVELGDLLALKLLVDEHAARHVWPQAPIGGLLDAAAPARRFDRQAQLGQRWTIFTSLVAVGVPPQELQRLRAHENDALVTTLLSWSAEARAPLWQAAYERRYRVEILDALVAHDSRGGASESPAEAQIVTCIDDREESFRRALEELSPGWQTFGYAGFFGIPMYWKALGEHRSRPLCPASVVPERIVLEELADGSASPLGAVTARSALVGRVVAALSIGARTALRGGLASLAGWGALLPLVSRTLFPRLHGRLAARHERPATRMTLFSTGQTDEHSGLPIGFTREEAADIVASALRTMGLTSNFASLVVTLGHGSRSLNNPHEAAHDCGACGGGRGGPNGRGFAIFANDPEVRVLLADRGIPIPESTWFIGGYHNTCDDSVDLYDLDAVPVHHQPLLERLQRDLDEARTLDAHERCRRFESAPLDLTPEEALHHVEGRAEDLSQPRPEYGHCTNALCLVGRRSWSRGLFLDRRVFLTSYDPRLDPDGTILGGLLASVGPVGAGISLEYYFSFVDPSRYGCDTKLPHNIAGLLGVMDGHSSDLRTGLPWQMVEIHEPVRLLNVIEGTPDQLDAVVATQPGLMRLIKNRWILVAAFDPETARAWFLEEEGWEEHRCEDPALPTVPSSLDWYQGRRGHLRPASVSAGTTTLGSVR